MKRAFPYYPKHLKRIALIPFNDARPRMPAPPRFAKYAGLPVDTKGLLIQGDNDLAYSPLRRSYGESIADRMDIMERLIQAVSNMSGVHTDYIAELFDFCLHKTNFDFWAAVRKFAEYHA